MTGIELLTPARVTEMRPYLAPILSAAADGNPVTRRDVDPEFWISRAEQDLCAVFVGTEDATPVSALIIQFSMTQGGVQAEVLAFAGKNLIAFARAYWDSIIEWLRANNVQSLTALTPDRLANIFRRRLRFTQQCAYVRMPLGSQA